MKIKQYILSSQSIELEFLDFLEIQFGDVFLYYEPSLEITKLQVEDIELCLLGFIINPLKPMLGHDEILRDLATKTTKEELFREIGHYSGRFLLLYRNNLDCIVLHDMFGQRQLNYYQTNNHLLLSSSVKLMVDILKDKVEFIPESSLLKQDKGFQRFDQWFLGDLTWIKQVKKLLPNHYFDFKRNSVQRIPFTQPNRMTEKEVLEYIREILQGNYKAVFNRYERVFQALTAGYDSRTLLALSNDFWKDIQFYTFNRGDANSKRDTHIAKHLSHQFQFHYQEVLNLPKNSSFEENYRSQFLVPRTTPKYYNVLYFSQFNNQKTINITGDGVQMVRNLRSPDQLKTAETLFDSLGYTHHPYHLENFNSWLESAKIYAKENEIRISDLFTHEIAQGQLTARWAHEFDLSGCEEFNPFSHKYMIYGNLQNIPYDQRISPNYIFQKKLIEYSVENMSKVKFNPPTWKDQLKKLIPKPF